jgi:hypothetical protein
VVEAFKSVRNTEELMDLYAVFRVRGSAWQKGLPLESQFGWAAHASFMNNLVTDGFVVLGGPLEGSNEVLLIVRATSPEAIANRLQQDPWSMSGLLRISSILPWTLRLGSLSGG